MSDRIGAFEIKVAVIAILIPVFLQIIPEAVRGISYPPFTFILPKLWSYSIGIIWGVVLFLGLFNLKSDIKDNEVGKRYNFGKFFDTAVISTAWLLGFLFLSYIIIFGNFYLGTIRALLISFLIYAFVWYVYIRRFKK